MSESRTLLTAFTSSRVRHFSGHEPDSNDGTSVIVDTARVNLSSVVSDALMNSGRSIISAHYRCIVAREFDAITSSLYLDVVVSSYLDVVVSSYLDVVVFRVHRRG
jgi:hypothetical protein